MARALFQKVAADLALQTELQKFWEESAVPFQRALWERFRRAFAENLNIVQLDVPAVSGYEYRDAPALIHPHIRRFLQEVGAREAAARRLTSGTGRREQ